MSNTGLEGGFTNAATESAAIFRATLNAMARPGVIETVVGAGSGILSPKPLSAAAGAVLLTLADHETPLHLAGAHDCAAVRQWLAFHTGARFVGRDQAVFAVGRWDDLMPRTDYRIGSAEFPDLSVTLIAECDALSTHGVAMRGPGIEHVAELNLPDPGFLDFNEARYPLGIDMILTAGSALAAVPRSTRRADQEG